jgi:hypothetical protein
MRRIRFALLALALCATVPAFAATPPEDPAIYIAYYWNARSGKEAAYETYIRTVALPIDEEARRAGAFEELRTYVPENPNGSWTHLRVFRLKNQAQFDAFTAAMDAAGRRIWPDADKRPKADDLRDLVRREVWKSFP